MAGDAHIFEPCKCGRGEARYEIPYNDDYLYVCKRCFEEDENRRDQKTAIAKKELKQ